MAKDMSQEQIIMDWQVLNISNIDIVVTPHLRFSMRIVVTLSTKTGSDCAHFSIPLRSDVIESLMSIANVDAGDDDISLSKIIGRPIRYGETNLFNKAVASIYDDEMLCLADL